VTGTSGPRFSRLDVAIALFAAPAVILAVGLASYHDRPLSLTAIAVTGAAVVLRRWPIAAGIAISVASAILRFGYIGIGYSTQVDHARTAMGRVLAGLTPYGVLLPSASAPPEPFTYGPLALLWWQPGVVVEFVAALAVMGLLIWTRSWITLAVYGGLPFAVFLTSTGVNDYSPGLLIASALLLLRTRPLVGAALLAVAAAIKPYALAWFLPAAGYAGWGATAVLVGGSALLWSPLLAWGPASFLRSIELHRQVHPDQANALDVPALRWLAIPLAMAGALVRRWNAMVLLGAAAFVAYLFLDRWASLGYWLAVIPATGIALEASRNSAVPTGRLAAAVARWRQPSRDTARARLAAWSEGRTGVPSRELPSARPRR
jgi:hypothetical protein